MNGQLPAAQAVAPTKIFRILPSEILKLFKVSFAVPAVIDAVLKELGPRSEPT